MRTSILLSTVGAISILAAPIAVAEDGGTILTPIGGAAELVNGDVIQAWTVLELQPSLDLIPYPVQGTLWEAIVTNQAVQGTVTPIIPDFNARADTGENYRALFEVATPLGVNPATLAQGQETGGKIYFDVVGPDPSSVVYNAMGRDLAVWQLPADETIIEDFEVVIDGDQAVITDDEVIIDGDQVATEDTEIVVQGDQQFEEQTELDIVGP
jgi:hypothetical protein